MTKLSMLTIALASMAFLSACDTEDSDTLRSSEYCMPVGQAQPPPETPRQMDIRQQVDGGPGWEAPSNCFCEDNATGEGFSGLCGDGVGCNACCADIGGWWPGCSVWPYLSGC